MRRRINPMKLAMDVCSIRNMPANPALLSSIIRGIKTNEVAGVGLTRDKDLSVEYIVFIDGTVTAGIDTFEDLLSEEGSTYGQDVFDSVEEMNARYSR